MAQRARFAYGIVQTAGGGLGLLCFGPLAERLGRRRAFAFMHVAALAVVPATCYLPHSYGQMLAILPLFGFFTLGIHAGYAIYFPELFPTRLRSTGTSFCYNVGRIVAALGPAALGVLTKYVYTTENGFQEGFRWAAVTMCSVFLIGLLALPFAPETKDQPLPD